MNFYKNCLFSCLLLILTGCAAQKNHDIIKRNAPSNYNFYLMVEAPSGARVRIMNIKPKYTDNIFLEKGKYHIEVSKSGFYTFNEWIFLNEDRKMKVILEKKESVKNGLPDKSSQQETNFIKAQNTKLLRLEIDGFVGSHDSFKATCKSGSSFIIYKADDNIWHREETGPIGDQTKSWNEQQVGEFLCQSGQVKRQTSLSNNGNQLEPKISTSSNKTTKILPTKSAITNEPLQKKTESVKAQGANLLSLEIDGFVGSQDSFKATCKSGSSFIIYKADDNTWHREETGPIGDQTKSWNEQQVGEFLCQSGQVKRQTSLSNNENQLEPKISTSSNKTAKILPTKSAITSEPLQKKTESVKAQGANLLSLEIDGFVGSQDSFKATCKSGSSFIIYKADDNTWHREETGPIGDQTKSWNEQQVGQFLCEKKELSTK